VATEIQLKHSQSSGNTPSSLADGEIAINTYDGKIYYKDPSNAIQSIEGYPGPSGLNQEIQFNDSGSLGANSGLAFNKSSGTLIVGNSVYSDNANTVAGITRLTVSPGSGVYYIDQYPGGSNPTIYVGAGETIAFDLNVSGHPFAIRDSSGGSNTSVGLTHVSTGGVISTGANAQGKHTGILYWKVPYNLVGSTYVYQCTIHGSMVGDIVITQPSSIVHTQANAAFIHANSAFDAANNATDTYVRGHANAAFDAANTAQIHANEAFDAANNATDTYVRGHANAAFDTANTNATNITTAQTHANKSFDHANAAFLTANTPSAHANAAFLTANTPSAHANAAYVHANSAFAAANSAGGGGSGTDTYARVHANASFVHANASFIHANAAFTTANTGGGGVSNDDYLPTDDFGFVGDPNISAFGEDLNTIYDCRTEPITPKKFFTKDLGFVS